MTPFFSLSTNTSSLLTCIRSSSSVNSQSSCSESTLLMEWSEYGGCNSSSSAAILFLYLEWNPSSLSSWQNTTWSRSDCWQLQEDVILIKHERVLQATFALLICQSVEFCLHICNCLPCFHQFTSMSYLLCQYQVKKKF